MTKFWPADNARCQGTPEDQCRTCLRHTADPTDNPREVWFLSPPKAANVPCPYYVNDNAQPA